MAIGFGLLTVPMVVMAWALLADGRFLLFAVAHLAVAASFLWVAADLIKKASLVDDGGRPLASLLALFLTFASLRIACPPDFGQEFGQMPVLTPGLFLLGAALALLAADDRKPNRLVGLAGRISLIVGGAVVGLAEIGRMLHGVAPYPAFSIALGAVGVLLFGMSIFEARLVLRGFALVRLDDQ